MKVIAMVLVFAYISISTMFLSKISAQNKADISASKLLLLAKAHDLALLERMGTDISKLADKRLRIVYALALYIASPDRYKQQFVDNFPDDYEDIMKYLYEQIELKELTPSFLYSFESLGVIAQEGNSTAIKKVFNAYIHSDGVVAGVFCEAMNSLVYQHNTRKALLSISELSEPDRRTIYQCFEHQGPGGISGLRSYLTDFKKRASRPELEIIKEIDLLN